MPRNVPTHPYLPNATPEARKYMLSRLGIHSPHELYDVSPPQLRLRDALDLPAALVAEADLRREIERILARSTTN